MKYIFLFIIIFVSCSISCSQEQENSSPKKGDAVQPAKNSDESTPAPPSFLMEEQDKKEDYASKYTIAPPEDDTMIQIGNHQMSKPASWIWIPPKSVFTLSNYTLPGILGEESGMFSISQFEAGEGGDFDINVERWKGHFRNDGGAPIRPIISQIDINKVPAQMVHMRGEYMGAGAAWHRMNFSHSEWSWLIETHDPNSHQVREVQLLKNLTCILKGFHRSDQ